jgi:hypothetical protein
MPKRKTMLKVMGAVFLLLALTWAFLRYEHTVHLNNLTGTWEGAMHFHGGPFMRTQRILLKVFKENGSYHAVIDEIDVGIRNIPATHLDAGWTGVNFESESGFSYQGKFNREGTEISGRWKWPGGYSQPLALTRTATPDAVREPLVEADYTPRAGSDLQGLWKAILNAGQSLRLHLKITESADGTFRAELNSIDQPPVIPLPVTVLDYKKPQVKFSIQGIGASFTGELNDSGSQITGTWIQVKPAALTFERVNPKDEARLSDAGKNYTFASDAELQGHWTGTLPGNYGVPLRLVFNIARLADGSFSATVDSPDQSEFATPFDVATFSPPAVRLEMKSANRIFEGRLVDGKLSGTWNLNKKISEPLTMERKKEI